MHLATPDDSPEQPFIACIEDCTLKGYGRRQHGLYGKDADLGPSGQCVVGGLVVEDPVKSETMFLRADLLIYATICGPDMENSECWLRPLLKDEVKEHLPEGWVDAIQEWLEGDEFPETEETVEKIINDLHSAAAESVSFRNHSVEPWWNDGAWEPSLRISVRVPMTVDEYEDACRGETDVVVERLAKHIYDEEDDTLREWQEDLREIHKALDATTG